MSSSELPTLSIDVTSRRSERIVVIAMLALVAAAISRFNLSAASAALLGVAAMAAIGFGFQSLGWVGGRRRLTRIVCQSDGRWLLADASGRSVEAELSTATRVSPHVLWLYWDAVPARALLLVAGDVPASEFRRLVMRLRLVPIRNDREREAAC